MTSRTDEERFRSLYLRHQPAITAYFVRRIGRQDALDATDEVFTVAWRRFHHVPDGSEALLWLYGVARNVAFHRERGARRGNRLIARIGSLRQPVVSGPEAETLQHLEGEEVARAMATLRSTDRELLRLSYWEGLTHRQIGQMLGISKSAVDSRVHRALERMRKAMSGTGHVLEDKSAAPPLWEQT